MLSNIIHLIPPILHDWGIGGVGLCSRFRLTATLERTFGMF